MLIWDFVSRRLMVLRDGFYLSSLMCRSLYEETLSLYFEPFLFDLCKWCGSGCSSGLWRGLPPLWILMHSMDGVSIFRQVLSFFAEMCREIYGGGKEYSQNVEFSATCEMFSMWLSVLSTRIIWWIEYVLRRVGSISLNHAILDSL